MAFNNIIWIGGEQDQYAKVPLYWGITADGNVAFADDADLLKGACGKSLASFPQGEKRNFAFSVLYELNWVELLIALVSLVIIKCGYNWV